MPSTQEIRRRIKSVKNTRQITKAMEMVAASKMRRAQEATMQTRAYAHQALQLMSNLAAKTKKELHPLLSEREIKRVLAIVVTSDKGLCGAYNGAALRATLQFLKENADKEVEIISIGKKGQNVLKRTGKNLVGIYNDFPVHPTSLDVAPIARTAINGFINKEYDQIVVIFTNFVSTLRQVPTVKVVLPLSLVRLSEILEETAEETLSYEYMYEPSAEATLEYILPRLSEMQIFHAILESIASEQSARMMAMKNASENASELINDLTLTYNSIRQASITQELAEVSAGVEALK